MNYKELRAKYPKFYFSSYEWKIIESDLDVIYHFSAGEEYTFTPRLSFKNIDTNRVDIIRDQIDNIVFNIGMVELLSYWKAFVSPEIVIECGNLDDYQKKWWHDLLINGMGQFFYENKIDIAGSGFVRYVSVGSTKSSKPAKMKSDGILIPIGGGKDSAVTAEILFENFRNTSAFLLNPSKASLETTELTGLGSVIVEREIDTKILELNKNGFLNGHTPFTALLSFSSILSAVIGGFASVVFSNERSADEENVTYDEMKINHQYSKSLDFENKFREYNLRYLSVVNYFSFLRPIYDIQIVKIFSQFVKYFSVIRSCNVGQKTNSWCGRCPKCLSTFILFYPFLEENTVKIFGKDLLKDKELDPILHSLIDENKVKPFECVGTRHELRVALGVDRDEAILSSWNSDNNLPEKYKEILKKYV